MKVKMEPRRIRSTEEKLIIQPRWSRGSGKAKDGCGGNAKNKVEAHAEKRKREKRKSERES